MNPFKLECYMDYHEELKKLKLLVDVTPMDDYVNGGFDHQKFTVPRIRKGHIEHFLSFFFVSKLSHLDPIPNS